MVGGAKKWARIESEGREALWEGKFGRSSFKMKRWVKEATKNVRTEVSWEQRPAFSLLILTFILSGL